MLLHLSGSIFKVIIKRDFYTAVPEPLNHTMATLVPWSIYSYVFSLNLKIMGWFYCLIRKNFLLRGYFPSQWWQVCLTCSYTFSFPWSLLSWAWEWFIELATLQAALWRQHRQDPLIRGGEFSRSPGRVWLLPQRAYMLRKVFMEITLSWPVTYFVWVWNFYFPGVQDFVDQ